VPSPLTRRYPLYVVIQPGFWKPAHCVAVHEDYIAVDEREQTGMYWKR